MADSGLHPGGQSLTLDFCFQDWLAESRARPDGWLWDHVPKWYCSGCWGDFPRACGTSGCLGIVHADFHAPSDSLRYKCDACGSEKCP